MAPDRVSWDELVMKLAVHTVELTPGSDSRGRTGCRAPGDAEARVARAVRAIDRHPAAPLTLARMAAMRA